MTVDIPAQLEPDPVLDDAIVDDDDVVEHLSIGRRFGRFARREPVATAALAFIVLLVIASILAPLWVPHDPIEQSIADRLQSPSAEHWLGTDDVGRDQFARLVYGARFSLLGSALAVVVALIIGIPLGIMSGYIGGFTDTALMRITDTILAFPGIVLAIGVVGVFGPSLVNSMTAIGILFAPSVARIARGQVMYLRDEPFTQAAVTFGIPRRTILRRHVMPNAMPPVVVAAALLLATGLLAEASLSFLGLGVQPPTPSWGSMLGRGYAYIATAPMQLLPPGLMIVACALAFNLIGDGLRRQLDPRQR
jgi:peptide/nickel transport system permease protein